MSNSRISLYQIAAITLGMMSAAAHADLGSALNDCLSQNGQLVKVRTHGKPTTSAGIRCSGWAARQLFEDVRFYSRQGKPYKDFWGNEILPVYFGNEGQATAPQSQCRRVVKRARGQWTPKYSCTLQVDLNKATLSSEIFSELQGCANESKGPRKGRVTGTSKTALQYSCGGNTARSLYDRLHFYGKDSDLKSNDNGQLTLVRSFGDLQAPSHCTNVLRDVTGRSVDYFQCNLLINLSPEILQAM